MFNFFFLVAILFMQLFQVHFTINVFKIFYFLLFLN